MTGCKFQNTDKPEYGKVSKNATQIVLSDEKITVNGTEISDDKTETVYTANDIIYYPEGKDFTFGEGEKQDEHSEIDAKAHTVVHIRKAGDYILSGKLSKGQIAVDLGENAKDDPNAVVTLAFNGADIECQVAPAVIFYNVYECGEKDVETAKMDVDTTSGGANVVVCDGSVNNIKGAYVAKIYKSVELSEDGKEVVDSKKLHKYDGAFYSRMSMNIYGGKLGDGILNITGKNEGLDTELHLTLFGGNVNISSGNDGINTNEDNVSVTAINGGNLNITVTGETGEGDGIDSNGWLIINGGTVTASACGKSADSGIDADMGVYINGGTVLASGNMTDRMMGGQGYSVFSFDGVFDKNTKEGNTYTIKNQNGDEVTNYTPSNDFTNIVISSPELTEGEYSLWLGNNNLKVAKSDGKAGMHGGMPQMGERPEEMPGRPEGNMGERPERKMEERPPMGQKPIPTEVPKMPDGKTPTKEQFEEWNKKRMNLEYSDTFTVEKGENYFMVSTEI